MKKLIKSILYYTVAIFVVFFLIGGFTNRSSNIISSDAAGYRLNNGLLFVLQVAPSALLTAFLVGCAISFNSPVSKNKRFTQEVSKWFKCVFLTGLVLTFVSTVAYNALLPVCVQKQSVYETKRGLINDYLNLSQSYLYRSIKDKRFVDLSVFYAKKVLELDKNNKTAKDIIERSDAARSLRSGSSATKSVSVHENRNKETRIEDYSELFKIKKSSVLELVQIAEKFFDAKDYLSCHYYAQYAVKMADGKDANLEKAKSLANKSWNILSKVKEQTLTQENLFFREKLNGYTKLISNDYLSAYYIFRRLHNMGYEYSKDPDVSRYLKIANYELSKNYFFTDESTDKDTFESANDVYFSIKHNDGSYEIYFIKGITDIASTGSLVKYLRDLSIFYFDGNGNFIKSMQTPYAKLLASDASLIEENDKRLMSIDMKWKLIPYLMLCSVDRDNEGVLVGPEYLDSSSNPITGENSFFVPIPYNDFLILSDKSAFSNGINLFGLNQLKQNADDYGYSKEVIMQSTMYNIFYPFAYLIVLIICAAVAWNYRRIDVDEPFKFKWVLIYPVVQVISVGLILFVMFFVRLMNFIFIGIAGVSFGVYLGVAFYIILLILSCILFLSRKCD